MRVLNSFFSKFKSEYNKCYIMLSDNRKLYVFSIIALTVVGIDISKEMIASAKERVEKENLKA